MKTDWDGLQDGLGLGRFDANYTLIMYLLKPIEQGLDVKITGGVHSGCLRVQVRPQVPRQDGRRPQGEDDRHPDHGEPPVPRSPAGPSRRPEMDPRTDVT